MEIVGKQRAERSPSRGFYFLLNAVRSNIHVLVVLPAALGFQEAASTLCASSSPGSALPTPWSGAEIIRLCPMPASVPLKSHSFQQRDNPFPAEIIEAAVKQNNYNFLFSIDIFSPNLSKSSNKYEYCANRCFLELGVCFFFKVKEMFSALLLKYILDPFISSPSGPPIVWMLMCLILF